MNKRNFRGRRGQQAMEYMVTYGWAFVVIIVTIGAFAYFGLLNPEKYLPNRCDFGMQLKCIDYLMLDAQPDNGFVYLRFQNAFGENITIINVQTPGEEGGGTFYVDDDGDDDPSSGLMVNTINIADGKENSLPIVLDLDPQDIYVLVKKDKTLIPLVITFSRESTILNPNPPQHTVVGEVYATVQ